MINIKKIYIIQLQSYTIPSKVIKGITKGRYSHVGLSFDKNCDEIYSFGRKKLNNFLKGGFTKENRDGAFFKKFNESICKIYELEISDKKYNNLKNMIMDMEDNKEIYTYDNIGLILRYLHVPITFKNKYVCSYFIADILEKNEIYKFNKKTCFIKPKDFDDLLGTVIYEGKYLKE